MAINENCTGNNCVAITGTATGEESKGIIGKGNGPKTYGVVGYGEAVGVQGEGTTWHGVVGLSKSTTGGFGVYGKNTAGGTGVVGESTSWLGVYGKSDSTTGGVGVMGEGKGTGVSGVGKTWIGVYGETNASANVGAAGVWGEGKDGGDGVKGHASAQGKAGVAGFHLTNKGPGIFGKGSPAGFFEGNVNITGNLNVNGFVFMGGDTVTPLSSWITRIRNLEAEVADLRSKLSSSGHSPGSTSTSAIIGVELKLQQGAFNNLRIFGSGFQSNEPIEITVTSRSISGSSGSSTATSTADSTGRFSHIIGVSCPSGMQTTHTAFARGITSGRISNQAGASC